MGHLGMKPSDVAFAADIDVRCWQSQQLSSTLSQSPQQGIQRFFHRRGLQQT